MEVHLELIASLGYRSLYIERIRNKTYQINQEERVFVKLHLQARVFRVDTVWSDVLEFLALWKFQENGSIGIKNEYPLTRIL